MAAVFQLVKSPLSVAPGQPLLKAAEYVEFLAATELVARLEARQQEIEAHAESLYQEKRLAGYQQGLKEGRFEYAGKIMETAMNAVEYLENLETSLVKIVGDIVRKMLGELDHDELIIRLVRQALQAVRNERRVRIRVAPRDEAAVSLGLAGLLQQKSGGAEGFLDVIADPELAPGSCVLESDLGVIEASVETQLQNLEYALLKQVKHE